VNFTAASATGVASWIAGRACLWVAVTAATAAAAVLTLAVLCAVLAAAPSMAADFTGTIWLVRPPTTPSTAT
jgi:hypothetical protein